MVLRVGVVGAGAAGLCAGRNMIDQPDKYQFIIFEQTADVGGTWSYTNLIDKDENDLPVHSSMYKNLRTNVPKEIMGFPDFSFPQDGHSFTHHTTVLNYLKSYAREHKIYDKIKFKHHVISINPTDPKDPRTTWKFSVNDHSSSTKTSTEYIFDAVMICNGHYAVPNIPSIPGIATFKGTQIHSHCYREADTFRDKIVLVLGAASSGMDISIEVATVAKTIYLSHNLPKKHTCELPRNVHQVPGIVEAHPNGFKLLDGNFVNADVILYCTGYQFNFPFLSDSCGVSIKGNRVMPLYKHLIHIDFPTMAFIGLPFTVLPFPMFHYQAKYFLSTLDESIKLPSKQDMLEEAEQDFKKRTVDMRMPPKHAHKMGPLQWDYFQELCNEIHFDNLPPVIRNIYDTVEKRRQEHVMWYKKEEFKVISASEYVRTMPEP